MKAKEFSIAVILIAMLFSCNIHSKDEEPNSKHPVSAGAEQSQAFKVNHLSGKLKYGEEIKIGYRPLNLLIHDLRKRAVKENWEKSRLRSSISMYNRKYAGGIIEVELKGNSLDPKNTSPGKIAVKNRKEIVLFQSELDRASQSGDTPSPYDLWDVYAEGIPQKWEPPIYVFVILKREPLPSKFEIIEIRK